MSHLPGRLGSLCVPFFHYVGLGGRLMSVKDGATFPDLGRGGGSKLMGKHASVCARVCACARMGTRVAAPLLGTSVPKTRTAGNGEGCAAEAWCLHCTGARQLKAGVPHRAWG